MVFFPFYRWLVIGAVILLSACQFSTPGKDSKEIDIEIIASSEVNPNDNGQATPVSIRIYELKSTDAFAMSDYFTITEEADPELLAETKKVYEAMIRPEEKREVTLVPEAETIALGFVAAYRDISHADAIKIWLLPVKKKRAWYLKWLPKWLPSGSLNLQLMVEPLAISVRKVD